MLIDFWLLADEVSTLSLILLTTQTMVTTGILPHKENSHGRAGNRSRDLVIISQKLWSLDHEAGQPLYLLRICTYHFDSYMLVVVQVLSCKQERNTINDAQLTLHLKMHIHFSHRNTLRNCSTRKWIRDRRTKMKNIFFRKVIFYTVPYLTALGADTKLF